MTQFSIIQKKVSLFLIFSIMIIKTVMLNQDIHIRIKMDECTLYKQCMEKVLVHQENLAIKLSYLLQDHIGDGIKKELTKQCEMELLFFHEMVKENLDLKII